MPKFDKNDSDALFEHVAEVRGWTQRHKTLMLQFVFTGKSQRAFFALSSAQSGGDYAKVKGTDLKAYALVQESQRQRFRNWKEGHNQNHVELVQDILAHFTCWYSKTM